MRAVNYYFTLYILEKQLNAYNILYQLEDMIAMIHKLSRLFTDLDTKLLGGICCTVLVIILIAGLWPFNFFPKNKVARLQDKNGVYFSDQGMILSLDYLNDPQQLLLNKKSITIEIVIRPTEEPPNNINRILSFNDDRGSEISFIGQWKKHLIIRSRIKRSVANVLYREIGVRDSLGKDQNCLLSVRSCAQGTDIYINGKLAQTYPHQLMLDSMNSDKIGLILGNSPVGKNSWNGQIMALAIYNRTFTAEQYFNNYQLYFKNNFTMPQGREGLIGLYLFNEKMGVIVQDYSNMNNHLTIPAIFRPVKKVILETAWQDFRWNWSFVQDTVVNLLGFIPLGFFFTFFLLKVRNWNKSIIYLVVIMSGLVLSLSIELLQVYLPSRYSQMDDVICNFVGSVLGVIILHIALPVQTK